MSNQDRNRNEGGQKKQGQQQGQGNQQSQREEDREGGSDREIGGGSQRNRSGGSVDDSDLQTEGNLGNERNRNQPDNKQGQTGKRETNR